MKNANIMKLHSILDKQELQMNRQLDFTNVQNVSTGGENTKLSDHWTLKVYILSETRFLL